MGVPPPPPPGSEGSGNITWIESRTRTRSRTPKKKSILKILKKGDILNESGHMKFHIVVFNLALEIISKTLMFRISRSDTRQAEVSYT